MLWNVIIVGQGYKKMMDKLNFRRNKGIQIQKTNPEGKRVNIKEWRRNLKRYCWCCIRWKLVYIVWTVSFYMVSEGYSWIDIVAHVSLLQQVWPAWQVCLCKPAQVQYLNKLNLRVYDIDKIWQQVKEEHLVTENLVSIFPGIDLTALRLNTKSWLSCLPLICWWEAAIHALDWSWKKMDVKMMMIMMRMKSKLKTHQLG